jgi:hypothetical protein
VNPTGSRQEATLRRALLALLQGESQVGEVDALALEILRFQALSNPVYGALLRNRALDPEALEHWTDFPPVPVAAYRDHPPYLGDVQTAEATFRTSGTTGGGERRGVHRVRDLSLYRASLLPPATLALRLPGESADATLRVLSLLPSPEDRPDSSLSHMAGVLRETWDDGQGGFFVDAHGEPDLAGLEQGVARARADGIPVLFLTTAFALVHLLDARGSQFMLPDGSRVMETGGFKGRSREIPRGALYAEAADVLGIPTDRIVNEYGMTEMLSQFYEPVLAEGGPGQPELRRHTAPPWVRTRILHPEDLSPVPPGEPGLLCHLDLANLYSAALLLTEDLGVEVPAPSGRPGAKPGFRILGRAPGATPRGCSLSMEAWLEAAR